MNQRVRRFVMVRLLVSLIVGSMSLLALASHASASVGLLKMAVGNDNKIWALASDYSLRAYDLGSHTWTTYFTGENGTQSLTGLADSLLTPGDKIFLIWGSGGSGTVWGYNLGTGVGWTQYTQGAVGVMFKKIVADGYSIWGLTADPKLAGASVMQLDMSAAQPTWKIYEPYNITFYDIAGENGYLFFQGLPANGTAYTAWSLSEYNKIFTQWGKPLGYLIAGDANGYPYVATNASSYPLYCGNTGSMKACGNFNRPVYALGVESYSDWYVLSTPVVSGGYSLYGGALGGTLSPIALPN
jgi:hypothetical protein